MIDTALDALAADVVAQYDTDKLHKLPTDTVGALQALAFGGPHNDPCDIFQCNSDNARFVTAVQQALRTRGRFMLTTRMSEYETAVAACEWHAARDALAELVMELVDALTHEPALEALQRAYDDAHPDNSTEADDMRQRARDLRATA